MYGKSDIPISEGSNMEEDITELSSLMIVQKNSSQTSSSAC